MRRASSSMTCSISLIRGHREEAMRIASALSFIKHSSISAWMAKVLLDRSRSI